MKSTIKPTESPARSMRFAARPGCRGMARRTRPAIGLAALSAAIAVTGTVVWTLMHRQDLFRDVFPPLTLWAADRVVPGRNRSRLEPARGRFTRADAKRVVAHAWDHYDARVHGIPSQPTIGSQLVLRIACWTAGYFHSLRDEGMERSDAVDLTADVVWRVFQLEGRFGQVLTRIRPELTTQPRRRLPDGTIDLGFPFGPPAYQARPAAGGGIRSFEVVRCPAAAYFREHGLADLGQAAFCDMDYALSEMQRLTLERRCTLMAGDDHCDFRWAAAPAPQPGEQVRT